MLALTLMVGIVIDDAIIVLENIYRFMEEKGMPPMQAAIEGTKEIGLAVMATTLSLLAVFLPIGFMGGIVGRFMSSFGFTASFAIAVSLLVSFTLTPMLCSRFIKMPKVGAGRLAPLLERFEILPASSTSTTRACSSGPWRTARSMVALCVVVSLSTIPLFMLVGKNFLPADDRSEFQVTLKAPEGTSLAATLTIAERIARDFRGHDRRRQRLLPPSVPPPAASSGPPPPTAPPSTSSWFPSISADYVAGTNDVPRARLDEELSGGSAHRRACKPAAAAADKPTSNTSSTARISTSSTNTATQNRRQAQHIPGVADADHVPGLRQARTAR